MISRNKKAFTPDIASPRRLLSVGAKIGATPKHATGASFKPLGVASVPASKRAPRGTYQNKAEAQRAWRKRNSEKVRTHLRLWKYSRLKYQAKRRGLEFSLTREDFSEIRDGAACHYCGGSLPNFGYALDRKDNGQGYTRENVVPCCEICNTVKSNRLSYLEMLELGKAVANIRLRRLQAGPSPPLREL